MRQRASSIVRPTPPISPPYQVKPDPVSATPQKSSLASDQCSNRYQIRAPTMPPTAVVRMASKMKSERTPWRFSSGSATASAGTMMDSAMNSPKL